MARHMGLLLLRLGADDGHDLPQGQAAVVGRYALVPVETKALGAQALHDPFGTYGR